MYHATVLLLLYINLTLSVKVIWLPSTSFNLPSNFNGGKLPCSKQTVVFPETVTSAIQIESETSVSGFILPIDGEIYLAEGVFELGPTEEVNCTAGNVYYMEQSIASWSQPGVWSSAKFNKATPDAERIPCFDDIVEFPSNVTYNVVLPDSTQSIQGLIVYGQYYDTKGFRDYVKDASNENQFILNQYQETGINVVKNNYCKSRSGCPCQNRMIESDCTAKFCERSTCTDPIQPIGHCCKICGGALVLDIDQSFDIMQFKELVERIVDSYNSDNLIYHIGRLPLVNKVQVVVVENNEYDQTSAEVVNTISNNVEKHLNKQMLVSGSPLHKAGFGWKIFISMFFAVVLVFAGVYVFYYKTPHPNFPIKMGRSHLGMFSRFNRRTESVVSLTRRDSTAPLGVGTATAFRNPLYDSKRGREPVEESVVEE